MAARALFALLHGDKRRPTDDELLGALIVSDAIDDLRTLAIIERARAEADAKAARKAKARPQRKR